MYRPQNPLCTNSTNLQYKIHDSADQPLGHFKYGCACTLSIWLLSQARQVVVPVDYHLSDSKNVEEICPCNYETAMQSWSAFARPNQPPQLERIQESLPRITLDPRVIAYKLQGILHIDLDALAAAARRMFDSESLDPNPETLQMFTEAERLAEECAQGSLEECKSMDDRAYVGDLYGVECYADASHLGAHRCGRV
jgi:hypothetical protein